MNDAFPEKGRQVVKKVISECLICKKYALKPAKQLTGQLPRDRVAESPPFAVVGIDFTGAITIKTGDQNCKKVHIALFTCAVTRAVHIKVVSDMSVKSFIFALRRFLSRRGGCKVIYSDNAKRFRCTCEIIKGFKKIIVDLSVQEFISSKGVTWKFIPERSPWWGGFWERLMKSIKDPLRKY
ncbi:reverse transcriptase [Caerostris extrusa]|uniref:Reverse transcriptase n=1 Tax=Caerostris extrusa TaxID=172846 RepID=A0AAV4UIL9_CAEEX|nr:reverse transcriptase [Caerostris extrusa]